MTVLTLEGTIDKNGRIQLKKNVALPIHATVYVIVPDLQSDFVLNESSVIYSPRLANPAEAHLFEMDVTEDG